MARARGANAIMAGAFSATGYGGIPASGFRRLPFVTSNLGEEQGLINSDLLGYGRDPQEVGDDVINDEGAVVVPVDLRNFGWWLKLFLGDPVTTTGVAASGSLVFSAQPATLSIVTINGTAVTFTTGAPTAGQVKVGDTLADTVAALVYFLNASADANISPATYSASLDGTTLNIVHDTIGTAGNAFTLAKGATPNPNCTLSGATLTGGAAAGAKNHVFTGGALTLPDAAVEIGMPDVPHYGMNYGVMGNNMAISLQRSGLLNATLDLIAQGENTGAASLAGTLDEYAIERFSQFAGLVQRDGVPLGKVESASIRISNNLDKDESIRPDGRIGGADPGMLAVTGEIVVRFADRALFNLATNKTPISLGLGWSNGVGKALTFLMERVRLPRPKVPLTGPNGVRATFAWKATEHPTLHRTVRVILINDVTSY